MSAVLVEQRSGIAVVTLNRPHALNAVDDALRAALIAALADANRDAAVRAVVITGAGDRAFCAGQDLEETLAIGVAGVDAWLERQHAMYQAVRDLDKPCVAAFNGPVPEGWRRADRRLPRGLRALHPQRGRQVGQGRAGRKHQGGLTPSSGPPASACRGRRRQYVMEPSRTPRAAERTRA